MRSTSPSTARRPPGSPWSPQVSASVYDVTVSGGDLVSFNGAVGLDLAAGQNIQDLAANALPAGEPVTADETYVLDNTPCAVTSILRQIPLNSPTNATAVTFRVTFAEDVQNVGPADFVLGPSTATGAINAVVVQSASVYEVVITGVGGNGALDLNFAPASDIADMLGNPLGAAPVIVTEQTYIIQKVDTATTLSAAPNPSTFGESVTFTATVTMIPPGRGTPTGTVTFLDGAATVGTGTLIDATATFRTSALAVGTHLITARYDGSFSGSASTPVSQVVNQDARIDGVDYPPQICAGERATLTAQVSGTGSFVFTWSESEDGVTFTPIPGATGSSYTTPALSLKRVYKVELEDACGTASQIAVVEVSQPLVITRQPVGTEAPSWCSVTLTVGYTGTESVAIQWYEGARGDTTHPVENATGAVFQTPALDRDAVYWARLQNACGTVDSEAAAVTILNVYYLPHAAATDLWWTALDLVNAGEAAQPVSLDAYRADGTWLEHRDLDPLGPQAKVVLDAAALFAPATLAEDIWIKVTSKANLKGLLSFGTRDLTSEAALTFADEGYRQLVFPLVRQGAAASTRLRLINQSDAPVSAVATAYDAAGRPVGTCPLALASRQAVNLDVAAVFPAARESLAWIGVDGDNLLFGDAFVLSDTGQTLLVYPGLRNHGFR